MAYSLELEPSRAEGAPQLPQVVVGAERPETRTEAFQPQQDLTVRDYLASLLRRGPLILVVGALVAGTILGAFLIQPKLYSATAVVLVQGQDQTQLNPAAGAAGPDPAVVDSEVEVLRSQELVQRLVSSLGLEKDPLWNPALRPKDDKPAWLRAALQLLPGKSQRDGQAEDGEASLVLREVTKAISVKRRGLTNVIDIEVASRQPIQSAKIANGLIDVFRQFGQDERLETASQDSNWLADRLKELHQDTVVAENAAQQYRIQSGLLTTAGVSLTENQVSESQAGVLAARADVAEKEARFQQVENLVKAGGSADTLAGALNSEVIRDMRQREAELTRRQTELENTLGPLHPSVQSGRAELENVRGQIKSEVSRIQSSLNNELEVSQARLRTLEKNLSAARGTLGRNNVALVRLNELERSASVARGVYEDFLKRSHELNEQGQLKASNIRLVARAKAPSDPSSPNMVLGAALAIILGGAAGLGLALLLEWLDDGLRTGDDVERRVGAPSLASIPAIEKKKLRLLSAGERHPAGYIAARPMSALTEAFRVLRMAISYARRNAPCNVVAITSALPNDGKTTTALCLARASALSGLRVLLIDCDLRRCSMNGLLGIAPKSGLVQVLEGSIGWLETIGKDEASGAHILPLAEDSATVRDVFGGPAMPNLLRELRGLYDLVILDCPPVLAVAESRVLSVLADGTVIVARSGKTSARAMNAVLDQLGSVGANVIGIVLNCVNPRMAGRSSYKEALYYRDSEKGYYRL